MKVSVVIVNFNGKEYIEECVDSVLRSLPCCKPKIPHLNRSHRWRNSSDEKFLEVVVVENGSTDGSWDLLKKRYAHPHPHPRGVDVRVVRSRTNLFFAGGSNLGARRAKGDWVVFLNSDTVVSPNWLKEMMKLARRKTDMVQPRIMIYGTKIIDCLGGKYVWPGFGKAVGRGKLTSPIKGSLNAGPHIAGWLRARLRTFLGLAGAEGASFDQRFDYVNGTCFMVNREFFWQLGGFDEAFKYFYEDVDFCLRARKWGARFWGAKKAVIEHKGSLSFKQNVASDRVIFYYRRNRLITVYKNFRGVERCLRLMVLGFIYLVLPRKKVSFRAIKAAVSEGMKYWFNNLRIAEAGTGGDWLDLGCGEGELVQMLAERGVNAVGIDKKQGQEIERFKVAKLKFGVVSMYHVLEHLSNPGLVLKRVRKWLKPGGVLVVEVPLVGSMSERWLGKDFLTYLDKTHLNFWSKKELVELLNGYGWRVIRQGRTWHQFPFYLITAGFRGGYWKGLASLFLWLPFKLLSIVGLNDEIVRFYCKPN